MIKVITLGKLIGLLFLLCLPLLSVLFLKTPKITGMTSLALYWEPFFSSLVSLMSVFWSVCLSCPKRVGKIRWPKHMLKVLLTSDNRVIHFDYVLDRAASA